MKSCGRISKKVAILVVFLNFFCFGILAEQIHSFDSLFPKTWYVKARESCMQVWGACDELGNNHRRMTPTNQSIVIDAMIGRLVFADFCLDLLQSSKEIPSHNVSCVDMIQFERVVGAIEESLKKIHDFVGVDRGYCIKRVMDSLAKKANDFLYECPTGGQ